MTRFLIELATTTVTAYVITRMYRQSIANELTLALELDNEARDLMAKIEAKEANGEITIQEGSEDDNTEPDT